jgi:hypothetical protein
MKTVIQAWTHNFNIDHDHIEKYNYLKETNFYFGLGDLIRSTLKLYKLSKQMGFIFIVDIQLHPISEFLKTDTHPYSDYVLENKDNVKYVCYGAVEEYINNHNDNDIILMLTNDFCENEELDNETKQIIKNIFVPNYKFQNFINTKFSKIPFDKWNIFHYRVNDNYFLNKQENIDYDIYLDHLKNNKEQNDILITDTKKLKDYIFKKDDIFMFDTKICHLGLSVQSDEIRDTLFELFLIMHSNKIKTYCKIHAISGFVKWISKIL